MADILLQKPEAGSVVSITPNAEDRLVFEFEPGEALLERDGDNLVLSFEDGSSIQLADFYIAYTSENMPEFVIGEEIVPGEAFFAALGEELMPAAGNSSAPQGSGTGVGLTDADLYGGIDRETRLDQERENSDDDDDTPEGDGLLGGDDSSGFGADGGDGGDGGDSSTPPVDRRPEFEDSSSSGAVLANDLTTHDAGTRTDGGKLEFTLGDGSLTQQTITITLKDGSEHELNFDANNEATVNTEYGTLTFTRDPNPNPDGSYNLNYGYEQTKPYDHSDPADDDVAKGAESFQVTITDVDGDSATTDDIYINITDDAPVANLDKDELVAGELVATGNIITNDETSVDDGGVDGMGKELIEVTLPDSGMDGWKTPDGWTPSGNELAKFESDKGTLVINTDGSYTFTYTDKSLTDGEFDNFTFDYTIKDSDGDESSNKLEIKVEGTNDAPIIIVPDPSDPDSSVINVSVTEDGVGDGNPNEDAANPNADFADKPTATGKIVAEDVDGDSLSFGFVDEHDQPIAGMTQTGTYGTIELMPNGEYKYTLDNTEKSAADKLEEGQEVSETFTVRVSDGNGGFVDQEITVNITGTNDMPTLELSDNTLEIGEEGTTVGGVAKSTDVDVNDTTDFGVGLKDDTNTEPVTSNTVEGQYGTFKIDEDGNYTYEVDTTKTQGLGKDEPATEEFTVYVQDKNGAWVEQDVTVTIKGQDDAAQITIVDKLATEDAGLVGKGDNTDTGSFTFSDVDGMENGSVVITFGTGSATIKFDEDGNPTITDDTVEGVYGNLTITDVDGPDKDGNYTVEYEYVQDTALGHDVKDNTTESKSGDNFKVTITDGHGGETPANIDVTITDHGPSITLTDSTVDLSETEIKGGTEASKDGVSQDSGFVKLDFGGDGKASVDAFAWDLESAPNLITSDDNKEVTWGYGDDKTVLIGKDADGNEVIRVEMNVETGQFTTTLTQAVEHYHPEESDKGQDYNYDIVTDTDKIGETGNANQFGTSPDSDGKTDLNFGFTITDGDGDTASSNVTVNIQDDVIDVTNADDETVQLDAPKDLDLPDTGFFAGGATSNQLHESLNNDGSNLDTQDSWKWNEYNGTFYENTSTDKSTIELDGFSITGAVLQKQPDGSVTVDTSGVTLGWRDDKTDANKDGVDDYVAGLGMTSGVKGQSEFEVGASNEGSYEDGEKVEALIVKLPEGETAYGVDLDFGCLFNKTEDGGDSTDAAGEFVTLEFYKDGELVYTVKQLSGVAGGGESFNTSTVTEPFDEIRIIPTETGSDFVLTGVSFENYDNDIVATGSGTIETTGADGLKDANFESITIGSQTVTFDENGNPSGELTIDGVNVTLVPTGDNAYVAVHTDEHGAKTDYFTVSVGDDGKWTMHQHKPFDDEIKLEIGVTDSDGDSTSHTVTVVGDIAPVAVEDSQTLEEGQDFSGNIITNDTAGNDSDTHSGKEVTSVTPPATGWESLPFDEEAGEVGKFESDAGTITFNKDGSYTFEGKENGVDGDVSFEFGYTITDADGDTSNSTLDLNITDENVTLTPSALTAEDANLADTDSNNDVYEGAIGGLIGVDVASVTIVVDGTSHTLDMTDPNSANTVIGTEYGQISNVKYDATTGEITYDYTQVNAFEHGTSNHDETSPAESFGVVVTDKNGNTNDTTINVSITDDGPIAVDDANKPFTEGADDIRGNLLDNDSFGGDGFAGTNASIDSVESTVRVNGADTTWTKSTNTNGDTTLTNYSYGTITVKADGSYDFDSYGNTISQDTTFEFDYTIKDADGDSSSATLTLEMTDVDAATITATEIHVDESGISGNPDITGEAHNALDTGSIDVSSMNGVKDITIDGTLVKFDDKGIADKSVTTDLGTISNIKYDAGTGSITYSYTLNETIKHGDAGNDDESAVGEELTIVVRDKDYNPSEPTTITVNVEDDAPIDHSNVNTVTTTTTTDTATTILSIDFGADNGDGKTLEFGDDAVFTYTAENGWESSDPTKGTVTEHPDGSVSLESDGITLTNKGDSDLWIGKMNGIPEDGTRNETITLKDADGDDSSFALEGSRSDTSANMLVGLDSSLVQSIEPGANYNISIILDTSGSMYDDNFGDILGTDANGNELTRLDAACDAIIDFVTNTLYPHATSDLGGEVNLHITTFWGGLDVVVDGTQPLEDILSTVIAEVNGLRDLQNYEHGETGFHHNTNYHKGFNSAADWFDDVTANGYENKVFFLTDGAPYGETEQQRDDAYDRLVDSMTQKDANGDPIKDADGNNISGEVVAVGMGAGAPLDIINKYDSDSSATLVEDSDIAKLFEAEKGEIKESEGKTSVGVSSSGEDVLLGDFNQNDLKTILNAKLGIEVTDQMVVEYIQNYPNWLEETLSSVDGDTDLLLAGTGDDIVHGQGGDDFIIGDGNSDLLSAFAKDLGLEKEEGTVNETTGLLEGAYDPDNLGAAGTDTEAFVKDFMAEAKAETTQELAEKAEAMETNLDGDDTLYGGGGADIMFGLGGDDVIYGGSGDDIIFGGSGNDMIDGGEGADVIMGGTGDDLIILDINDIVSGGSDEDGTDLDVLLGSNTDLGDKDRVLDMMSEGDIEMAIFGDNVSGKNVDEVLSDIGLSKNADGEVDFSGWKEGNSQDIDGKTFTEFTTTTSEGDDMTVLIAKTSIETGTA